MIWLAAVRPSNGASHIGRLRVFIRTIAAFPRMSKLGMASANAIAVNSGTGACPDSDRVDNLPVNSPASSASVAMSHSPRYWLNELSLSSASSTVTSSHMLKMAKSLAGILNTAGIIGFAWARRHSMTPAIKIMANKTLRAAILCCIGQAIFSNVARPTSHQGVRVASILGWFCVRINGPCENV